MQALTAEELRNQCSLGDDARTWTGVARAVGVLGLATAFTLGYQATDGYVKFSSAYLVAYEFFLTITLGALFFVMVNHLVGSKWNVTVRRVAEIVAGGMPLLALLFLPILIPVLMRNDCLYRWVDHDLVANDHVLHGKEGYLNPVAFAIRAVVYFAVWIGLSRYYLRKSREQDITGDPQLTVRMRRLAAPFIILFALTLTFAAFDWLMSLEPHWFSTIFGVYIFAGSCLANFAVLILMTCFLQERGKLRDVVTREHYHDLGKWLFAWIVFWAYVSFSQFMLIWYADIPEETFWFQMRKPDPWWTISMVQIIGHFVIPFCGLLSRHVKRNKGTLAFWAAYMLLMHYIDLTWIAKPTHFPYSLGFSLIDVACIVGIGGLITGSFFARARGGLIAAIRDPLWHESVEFKNH